jgi:P27 family predicted phage terminase small subunit
MIEGNPGHRPLNEQEPTFPAPIDAFDEPPAELEDDETARREWRRLAPMMRAAGVITDADRGALLALCREWARYLSAYDKTTMLVVKAPSGYPMPNPYIPIANRALNNCIRLWAELGLTPSSRSRVQSGDGPGPGGDAFSEFDTPLPIEGTRH